MEFIADVLLISGAAGAAFYCIVLSRRLKRLNDLEKGVGGAIAVLSAQVDDMTKTLEVAQTTAMGSNESLTGLTTRAEDVAKRLEILVASMHDIPPSNEDQGEGFVTQQSVKDFATIQDQQEKSDESVSDSTFRSARVSPASAAA